MTHSIDITGKIGPLNNTFINPEWPMYSYERPAYIFWNAIANGLHKAGWTEEQIREWLQSKGPRHALDFALEEKLIQLGQEYAQTLVKP